MAKDPTQGPVSTYDADGNPITTNVDVPAVEEVIEEVTVDESTVEETVEETDTVDEDAADETVEEVEEGGEEQTAEEEEDEELETHDHEIPAPLTYNQAETMLLETPFLKLKELAIAEELKPDRSKKKIIRQLLDIWFAPSEAQASQEDGQSEMSVRVRRIKGLM